MTNSRISLAATFLLGAAALTAPASNLVINGGFEINSAAATNFNLSHAAWNALVTDIVSTGSASGEADLINASNGFFNAPLSGTWSGVICSNTADGHQDQLSFLLSSTVPSGTPFTLDFDARAEFAGSQVEAGLSSSVGAFGTLTVSGSPATGGWTHYNFAGVTATSVDNIAIRVLVGAPGSGGRCINLDNVSFDVVPEPGATLLAGLGLCGLITRRRRA